MILTVQDVRTQLPDLVVSSVGDDVLRERLIAIEAAIRTYTNNCFQDRRVRFSAPSLEFTLAGGSPFLRDGDTVQITESVNSGLYTIAAATEDGTRLTEELFPVGHNLVTKVVYPADVRSCALRLLEWQLTYGGKIGVKSETLSRHTVAYEDSGTLFGGYPVGILSGLQRYRKART